MTVLLYGDTLFLCTKHKVSPSGEATVNLLSVRQKSVVFPLTEAALLLKGKQHWFVHSPPGCADMIQASLIPKKEPPVQVVLFWHARPILRAGKTKMISGIPGLLALHTLGDKTVCMGKKRNAKLCNIHKKL